MQSLEYLFSVMPTKASMYLRLFIHLTLYISIKPDATLIEVAYSVSFPFIALCCFITSQNYSKKYLQVCKMFFTFVPFKNVTEMTDLTIQENRDKAISDLELAFLNELKGLGVELCKDAVCSIGDTFITIGISSIKNKNFKIESSSCIDLYPRNNKMIYRDKDLINFGTSGSFSPENKASYWRTIHAASVLKNWDKTFKLVNKYCGLYRDLVTEIMRVNNA